MYHLEQYGEASTALTTAVLCSESSRTKISCRFGHFVCPQANKQARFQIVGHLTQFLILIKAYNVEV
jgi:hypothetical protein